MDSVTSPSKTSPSSILLPSKNYFNQFKSNSNKSQNSEPKTINASRRNSDTIIQSSNCKNQYLKLPLSTIESKPINESANNIPSFLSSPTSGQLSPNESLFIYDTFLRPPSSPLSIRSNSSTSSNSPDQSQYSLYQEKSNILNNNVTNSGNNNNNNNNNNNYVNSSINVTHKSSLSLRMVPDLLKNFNSKFLSKRHSITVIKESKKLSKSNQTMFKVQSKSNLKTQMTSHLKLAKSHSNSEDLLKPSVKINLLSTENNSSAASQEKNVSFNEKYETSKKISESLINSIKLIKTQKPKRSRSAPNNKTFKTINNVACISSSKTKKEYICNKLSNTSSISSNHNLPCRYCEKPIELSKYKQSQSTNN
jgi:hypothetical protein